MGICWEKEIKSADILLCQIIFVILQT